LKAELKGETDKLQQVTGTYLPKLNDLMKRLGLDEVR
jgi:hypothetical protein